jgi:release factor glutamine methyltransferase
VFAGWTAVFTAGAVHVTNPEISKKNSQWTIKDVLEWTTAYFRSKEIRSPRLDAEVLLAHALDVDRLRLYLNFDRPLSENERSRFRNLVRRRVAREPVAYIIGRREFWSLPFRAVPGVLVPRPETEVLVEVVLEEIRQKDHPRILELGTGSGAVAVSILHDNSAACIVATDINGLALRTAALNARELQVQDRLNLVASNLFDAIAEKREFDVVCSNPPYVPTAAILNLDPEVRDFEPRAALDGGANGLDIVRRMVERAGSYLKQAGALAMEVGDGQADRVGELLAASGFADVTTYRDLAGVERVVKGSR